MTNWHGWPPQVWNGNAWKDIEPAALIERQAQEIERLMCEVARLQWLCDLRSGADG
jgi:hypothetical protein